MRTKVGILVALTMMSSVACLPPTTPPTPMPVIERMTNGNAASDGVAISNDGEWLAVLSRATDLTPEVDLEPGLDAFLIERATGEITRLTNVTGFDATSQEEPAIDISNDGNEVLVKLAVDQMFGLDVTSSSRTVVWDRTTNTATIPSSPDPLFVGVVSVLSSDGDTVYAAGRPALTGPFELVPGLLNWRTGEFNTFEWEGNSPDFPRIRESSPDDSKILVETVVTTDLPGGDTMRTNELRVLDVASGTSTLIRSYEHPTSGFVRLLVVDINDAGDIVVTGLRNDAEVTMLFSEHVRASDGVVTDLFADGFFAIAVIDDGRGVGPSINQADPTVPGPLVIRDVATGESEVIDDFSGDEPSPTPGGPLTSTVLSVTADGSAVAYSSPRQVDVPVDNNGSNLDIFVRTAS